MPLDAVCLTALRIELEGQLAGLKIDKIQQPEQDRILLSLRGFGASSRLLISAGTGDARIHFTEAVFENPQSPPMFCMLLRKHLSGAKIKSIKQKTLERAVEITLDGVDALGNPGEKHLIAELMGRYSNIILTDGDGRIIDCLRRVDGIMSERRQVLPGLFYMLPPTQDKADPLDTSREEFFKRLHEATEEMTGDKWLINTFGGLSPLVCRELINRAYGDTDKRVQAILSTDGGDALLTAFNGLMEDIRSGHFAPYILTDANGKPTDFSFTPILQYGSALTMERCDSFSSLLDAFYTRRFNMERMRQKSQSLTKTIKNAYDRIRRKLENQREELKKTYDRERMRELGDLVTANLYRIQKGESVLRTQDYYAEDEQDIDIRLDERLTPQQNAAKYYKNYTKAKKAESVLGEQISHGENEMEYLSSVLDELLRAASERDLQEIRRELTQTGYVRVQKTGKKEKQKQPVSVPLHFVSSTGYSITVGKNNVQNDALTHKQAFKTDVWLHAQKIPGSHVIISANGGVPDDVTLHEAAQLAAFYSQAGDSKKVPVDYALVKHVKKMPGGRPGMVTYTDYKTIIAEPDEGLAESLRVK